MDDITSDGVKIQELANIKAGLKFKGPKQLALNPVG